MPSGYTYGDSYGQIEGTNLAKDAARDSRYWNSIRAIQAAQQQALAEQQAAANQQFNFDRANRADASEAFGQRYSLARLGMDQRKTDLEENDLRWKHAAERPVDERERKFSFDVAMQRAVRGDFASLPEVQVAHPKLSMSEQQNILNASLESRKNQEGDFNFASNAAAALKKRSALEGYLNMPDPSEDHWYSGAVAPGPTNKGAVLKRPTLAPFYEDLAVTGSYLDKLSKDKRYSDLLTPNPNTGEMEPTMQRPRWMTQPQALQRNPPPLQPRFRVGQKVSQGGVIYQWDGQQMIPVR